MNIFFNFYFILGEGYIRSLGLSCAVLKYSNVDDYMQKNNAFNF